MIKASSTLVVALICCVFFAYDFSLRLMPQIKDTDNINDQFKVKELDVRLLPKATKQHIENILSHYDVEPKPEPKPIEPVKVDKPKIDIMSAEQQAAQQGTLSTLFDDNYQYKLLATFDDAGRKFAILSQHDLRNNVIKKIHIATGEFLASYQLTRIDTRTIQLTQGRRVIEMPLFLYKKNHD